MKHKYVKRLNKGQSALIVVTSHGDGRMIDRINVPHAHREQGIASLLLYEVLADADREGVKLYLCISAGDGMTDKQLEEWYRRKGFEECGALTWVRYPNVSKAQEDLFTMYQELQ